MYLHLLLFCVKMVSDKYKKLRSALEMPNIKSAKKRVLVNNKKTEQNKAIRSAVKTEIKKVDLLIKENKLEEAKVALSNAFSVIDSACSKNIYHANNAANKKAKLAKKVDAALKAVAPVEEVKVEAPVVEEVVEAPVKKTTTRKPRAKKVDAE
jgi:small subunit ribosomal protein S20